MPPRKRGPGRPPREIEAERLVVYLPVPLKRWVQHRAVDEDRDMSGIVAEALEQYRHKGKR